MLMLPTSIWSTGVCISLEMASWKQDTLKVYLLPLDLIPDDFRQRDKPDKKLLQKELTSALSLNLLPTKKIGQPR